MGKTCFVIAPIGKEKSDTRRRSDQVFKYIIEPAASECGYKAMRADQISEPGLITSQVIQHIVEDPLVIADLTERNPNVFYELALRHALKKPLVQISQKDEQIPFDVATMRTIAIDHHDLDSVEQAKKDLIGQIKTVEGRAPDKIDTPISVALDLQLMRRSDDLVQRTLAELVRSVSELRSEVESIQRPVPYRPSADLAKSLQKYMDYFELAKATRPRSTKDNDVATTIQEIIERGRDPSGETDSD
ncbi:MAG TPA: hypothetical protein VMY05_04940 [Acidobacteriota bacterium]|nr:hypothetical protein [Acidobacteriota bacterium]